MSALRLINETIGSSVSAIDITDVFSADFDIYKISMFLDNDSASSPQDVNMRLINSSGSLITASVSDKATLRLNTGASFNEFRATNSTEFQSSVGVVMDNPEGAGSISYLFNPFNSSSYTFMINQNSSAWNNSSRANHKSIFVLKQLSSCTGFRVYMNSTNFTTQTIIRTYGLRVDS